MPRAAAWYKRALRSAAFAAAACLRLNAASAAEWPDSPIARLEATALLATFEADLLSGSSATATLEHWCGAHGLASPAKIIADRVPNFVPTPPPQLRQELRIGRGDSLRYRRVRLTCGAWVLSEADNWYVPARLTPGMNRALDTSDEPFGKVVKPLRFERRTLSAELLWRPLPEHWEMAATRAELHPELAHGALTIPPKVLELRAVLVLPDGVPFSEVIETYTGNLLAFAPPSLPHVID